MGVNAMRRVFYGAVIGMTGMALAAPFSSVAAGAASTVRVYAPATVGVVAPTTGPTAAAASGQTVNHTQRGARSTSKSTDSPRRSQRRTALPQRRSRPRS